MNTDNQQIIIDFNQQTIMYIVSHSGEGTQGTLDQPAAVSDARYGTIATEQTSPAQYKLVEGRAQTTSTRSEHYNPDQPWDLSRMLGRWNYVDTVKWLATDDVGTNIKILDILPDLLTSEIAVMPFQRFNLARFKEVQIRFETVGYRYARGRVLVTFRPTQRTKTKITENIVPRQAITLGSLSLDPSDGTVAQFNIPFTYIRQYVDLVNNDVLGQLHFIVQNKFVPGTSGPSQCDIKVLFNLTESEFKQPRPGEASFASHLAPLQITSHSGLIEAAASEVKGLVKSILPDNIIGDALGGLLDAPQLGEQPVPIINKNVQYFNNSKNLQYVDSLTLDPSAQQLVDRDVFSTPVNEMNIKELLKKAEFVATVPWLASDPVGKVLFTDNVGPMTDVPSPATGNFLLGMLSYVSSFFTYWRGSIVYFVEVVGTQFHEGKIDFAFHPQISATASAGLAYKSRLSQYYRTNHVRNGNNMFGFRAIYPGDTPVKLVYTGLPLSDGPSDMAARFQDYFSGSVSLVVSTLLNAPESVQPDVELNIYKMAGPDYELFMNTAFGSSIQTTAYNPTRMHIESHSGEGGLVKRNTHWCDMPVETLGVGANMASDISQSHFGEYFHSLRDLAKRYTMSTVKSFTIPLTDPEVCSGIKPVLITLSYTPSGFGKSFLNRVASMYRNFRGATVHKVRLHITYDTPTLAQDMKFTAYLTPSPSNFQLNNDIAPNYLATSHTLGTQPHAYADETQVAEFKVPYLHSRTSSLVPQHFDAGLSPYEWNDFQETIINVLVFPKLPANLTPSTEEYLAISVDWLAALADEATYGVFIGLPNTYIGLDSAGQCLNPDSWRVTATARKPEEKQVKRIHRVRAPSRSREETVILPIIKPQSLKQL